MTKHTNRKKLFSVLLALLLMLSLFPVSAETTENAENAAAGVKMEDSSTPPIRLTRL